jgi:hypothetical protein
MTHDDVWFREAPRRIERRVSSNILIVASRRFYEPINSRVNRDASAVLRILDARQRSA